METIEKKTNPWEVVKEFGDESGYMVRVQKLSDNPPRYSRPRFSIEVGQIRKDGKFSRYMNPIYTVSGGRVTVVSSTAAIMGLLAQAEEYVMTELQQAVDNDSKFRAKWDAWSVDRFHDMDFRRGKGSRRTAKTERNSRKYGDRENQD